MELVTAERWERFVKHRGDWGRDLPLSAPPSQEMGLRELAGAAGGMDYGEVSIHRQMRVDGQLRSAR